jgi:hypothetical protein
MKDWWISRKDKRKGNALMLLYENPDDPLGISRIDGISNTHSFWHDFPNVDMFANILKWEFKTAYDVNATNVWTQVAGGSGTVLTVQDVRGGFAKAINGASDDNYYGYSAKYSNCTLEALKLTWFQTQIAVKDVSEADLFVGLMTPAATTGIFDARVDSIGFYLTDGSGLLYRETSKTSTPTQVSTGITMADTVVIKLGFVVVSTTAVYFYVDEQYVGCSTTNIPTAALGPAFGLRNGAAAANELSINTINVGLER